MICPTLEGIFKSKLRTVLESLITIKVAYFYSLRHPGGVDEDRQLDPRESSTEHSYSIMIIEALVLVHALFITPTIQALHAITTVHPAR